MQNTQTGIVHLDFVADVDQMVSAYSDAIVSPIGGTPGTVVRLYVYQYTSGNTVTFSGFTFEGGIDPVLGSNAGSSVMVLFACLAPNSFLELRREVVTT